MYLDTIEVKANNSIHTHHQIIKHENPKGLFLMLPGGNNASDGPIMHYLRKVMLDAGFDVLNIDYRGLLSKNEDSSMILDRLLKVIISTFA